VVCCQTDSFSLSGLDDLMKNVDLAKEYYNKDLSVAGILLTRYDSRTSISKRTAEMFRERAKDLGTRVFDTVIRESVAIKESQMRQCDIFDYSVTCHAAEDYAAFTKELYLVLGGDEKGWQKSSQSPNAIGLPRISIPRQQRKHTTMRRR
jgi:chromosome partitioning protein